MAMAGKGGAAHPRPDQQWRTPPPSVIAPGGAAGTFRGRYVVVYGTGPNTGVFVYSPSPATGNLIASIAAGDGTDPYGNDYLSGQTTYFLAGSSSRALQNDGATLTAWTGASDSGPWTEGPSLLEISGVWVVSTQIAAKDGTAAETWHTITLSSGWSTLSGQPVPSIRLLPDGRVATAGYAAHASFSGTSQIGSISSSAYWPATTQRVPGAYGVDIEITTGGLVNAFNAPSGSTQAGWSGAYPLDL